MVRQVSGYLKITGTEDEDEELKIENYLYIEKVVGG